MEGTTTILLIGGALFLVVLLLGSRRQSGPVDYHATLSVRDPRLDRGFESHHARAYNQNLGGGCLVGLAAIGFIVVLALVFVIGMSFAKQSGF